MPTEIHPHTNPFNVPWADAFWAKVAVDDGQDPCWKWIGSCNSNGYGQAYHCGGYNVPAHRASWVLHYGSIPNAKQVLHDCDVKCEAGNTSYRRCVNPAHLFLGTQRDNIRDARKKLRLRFGEGISWSKLTECDVREILSLYENGVSQRSIATRYGVTYQNIWMVVHRKNWKHVM